METSHSYRKTQCSPHHLTHAVAFAHDHLLAEVPTNAELVRMVNLLKLHGETLQDRILAGGDIAEELVLHTLQQLRRACGELVEVLVVLVQVARHSEVLHLGDVRGELEQLCQIELFNHVPVATHRQGRHAILLAVHAAVVVATRSLVIVVRLNRCATSTSVAVVRVGGRSVRVLLCVGALLLSLSSVAGCGNNTRGKE